MLCSIQLSISQRDIVLKYRPPTLMVSNSPLSITCTMRRCLVSFLLYYKCIRNGGPLRNYFLILLVFIGGMTSLALEMCASRLLGAYFGTSLFIWGNLIGLILLYLTVG